MLKPNCLTSDKRKLVSHTLMEATFNKLINEQEFVLPVRLSQVNKSRVSVLELKRNQTTIARPSFVSTGRTFISLCIHTVSCFDRLKCWLNSQRSPWDCRSFLERKRANKIKIKRQGHVPNVILKLSGKNTRSIERKL